MTAARALEWRIGLGFLRFKPIDSRVFDLGFMDTVIHSKGCSYLVDILRNHSLAVGKDAPVRSDCCKIYVFLNVFCLKPLFILQCFPRLGNPGALHGANNLARKPKPIGPRVHPGLAQLPPMTKQFPSRPRVYTYLNARAKCFSCKIMPFLIILLLINCCCCASFYRIPLCYL